MHLVLIDIDPSPCAKVHRDEASEVEKLSHSLLAARMTDPVHTIDKPAIYLMANDRILIKSAALRKWDNSLDVERCRERGCLDDITRG